MYNIWGVLSGSLIWAIILGFLSSVITSRWRLFLLKNIVIGFIGSVLVDLCFLTGLLPTNPNTPVLFLISSILGTILSVTAWNIISNRRLSLKRHSSTIPPSYLEPLTNQRIKTGYIEPQKRQPDPGSHQPGRNEAAFTPNYRLEQPERGLSASIPYFSSEKTPRSKKASTPNINSEQPQRDKGTVTPNPNSKQLQRSQSEPKLDSNSEPPRNPRITIPTLPPQTGKKEPIATAFDFEQRRHSPQVNIFISYRRQDNPHITGRIYDHLIHHFTKEQVFFDIDSIPIGEDFRIYIDEKVGQCKILIVIIGTDWLGKKDTEGKRRIDNPADFVRLEVESALKRGIPVIPILINGAMMVKEGDLPSTLRDLAYRNAISIRTDPDFHMDVKRLIAGLEWHLKKNTPNGSAE